MEMQMIKSTMATISIVLLLDAAVFAADHTWKFFKPNETTEESVFDMFGIPDGVNIQTSSEDLERAKEPGGRTDISTYVLTYNRSRGGLKVLKGPLGDAASAEVNIVDGIVVSVDWEYSVKYKAAAEELWKDSKSISTRVAGAIAYGSEKLADGNLLFVYCVTGKNGKCDGPIKVTVGREVQPR